VCKEGCVVDGALPRDCRGIVQMQDTTANEGLSICSWCNFASSGCAKSTNRPALHALLYPNALKHHAPAAAAWG
jgi:hypothetical protein